MACAYAIFAQFFSLEVAALLEKKKVSFENTTCKMAVSSLSHVSGLLARWDLSKCQNPAPKGSWPPAF